MPLARGISIRYCNAASPRRRVAAMYTSISCGSKGLNRCNAKSVQRLAAHSSTEPALSLSLSNDPFQFPRTINPLRFHYVRTDSLRTCQLRDRSRAFSARVYSRRARRDRTRRRRRRRRQRRAHTRTHKEREREREYRRSMIIDAYRRRITLR